VPVGEDAEQVVADLVADRLRQRGAEAEEDAGDDPEQGRLDCRPGPQRHQDQRHADADDHRAEDQPLVERRVVAAAARVGDRQEGDQRGRHEDRRADVAAGHPLCRQPVAERQREDHRGRQQRLNDGEPPDRQRDGLADEAEGVGGDPGQPDGLARHPQQQPRARPLGGVGLVEPGFLLQHRAEREQQRGGEGEGDVHRAVSPT
jgi:hypothetical protein